MPVKKVIPWSIFILLTVILLNLVFYSNYKKMSNSRWKPAVKYSVDGLAFKILPFMQCLVELLKTKDEDDHSTVEFRYNKDTLHVSPANSGIKLYHAPDCPFKLLEESFECDHECSVSLGSVVLLVSLDDFVFLTRRSKKLKTFPGVWVPPGGRVDKEETLLETGVRELKEETGIYLEEKEYESHLLCIFESCYPPFKEWGSPRCHHLVFYYLLRSNLTKDQLDKRVALHEFEVDASLWLELSLVENVIKEEHGLLPNNLSQRNILDGKEWFSSFCKDILVTNINGKFPDQDVERISTGTKIALSYLVKPAK